MKAAIFVLAALIAVSTQAAHAADESGAPFVTNDLKDADFGGLDDKSQKTSMDGNFNEAEQAANEEVARHAVQEADSIKRDIKELEKQVSGTKSAAERSLKQAQLASKKLDLVKAQNKEMSQRLAIAQRENKKAEAQKNAATEQLKRAEERRNATREKTRENSDAITQLQRENIGMARQLKQLQAQIDQEKSRQKSQAQKKAKLMADNRSLKAKRARSERYSKQSSNNF